MLSNRKPQRDPYFHKLNGYCASVFVRRALRPAYRACASGGLSQPCGNATPFLNPQLLLFLGHCVVPPVRVLYWSTSSLSWPSYTIETGKPETPPTKAVELLAFGLYTRRSRRDQPSVLVATRGALSDEVSPHTGVTASEARGQGRWPLSPGP